MIDEIDALEDRIADLEEQNGDIILDIIDLARMIRRLEDAVDKLQNPDYDQ